MKGAKKCKEKGIADTHLNICFSSTGREFSGTKTNFCANTEPQGCSF